MNTISTEKQYKVVLEDPGQAGTVITLVGVGGTGSALAIDLARLVYHCRQKGTNVWLQLVDHDKVEAKNVGRQQFSEFEIGKNKAESMAARLNMWLGLDIVALAEKFRHDTYLLYSGTETRIRVHRILVGAVDNWQARREMMEAMKKNSRTWWVDAGNGEYSGQVLLGNYDSNRYVVRLDKAFGLASGIPGPHLQMPELVEAPAALQETEPAADCALAVIRDEQSLNINRLMAVYTAQAVYDILVRREVTWMQASVSLNPPSVTHTPLTEAILSGLVEVDKGG